MEITAFTSNDEALTEIGQRLKDARIDFPLTQAQLAERSGVSLRTIANLESGHDITFGNLLSILRALSMLSRLELIAPQQEIRPSELAAQKPKRQRVRKTAAQTSHSWKWGDEQ